MTEKKQGEKVFNNRSEQKRVVMLPCKKDTQISNMSLYVKGNHEGEENYIYTVYIYKNTSQKGQNLIIFLATRWHR